jgi:hypothetical protein
LENSQARGHQTAWTCDNGGVHWFKEVM